MFQKGNHKTYLYWADIYARKPWVRIKGGIIGLAKIGLYLVSIAFRPIKFVSVVVTMVTDSLFQIATMKLLDPLTDKSKYNRRELVRFGGITDTTDRLCVGGIV